jgi:hypothetical protein
MALGFSAERTSRRTSTVAGVPDPGLGEAGYRDQSGLVNYMATTNGICSKSLASGSIVLMARVVDRAGAAIRPPDVMAIEYSAYEVDPFWPEQLTVMRGHNAAPLDACRVLFDSPQVGRYWSLDDVGYNFRHELTCDWREPLPHAQQRFEVAYQLTMMSGCRTTVRFKLRCSVPENPLPVRCASDYRTATNAARQCPATLGRPCSFGPSPQGGGSMKAI